ncbi:MAG TPA: DUF445 family protein [Candidatus Angelobacter sp.]|nr:DUF445 family protein [Candidatus Angelobacter sp.]
MPIMYADHNDVASMTKDWLGGLSAVAARQHELAATALIDMTEMLRCCLPGGDPQQVIVRQAEFARKTIEMTIANTRDMAGLVGVGAFNVVQEHIQAEVANWVSDPAHSSKVADFVVSKVPSTVAAIDRSGLPSFVGEHARMELERVEIASLVAGVLSGMVDHGRAQQLLDALLDGLEKLVSNKPAMEAVRQKIRSKLPSLFNLYHGEPVVMNKIVESAMTLIAEIRENPAHPLRTELDAYLASLAGRLRHSPELASRLEAIKLDLLERPELADLATRVWKGLRDFLVQDASSKDSQLRRQLERMLVEVGNQLPRTFAVRG